MNGITERKDNTSADWKVLLVGGSSGVGKTLVARELAQNLSISNLLVDDIRLAIQKITTAANEPDIHVFLNYRNENWERPERICSDWITVGNFMAKPLDAIIAHHVIVPTAGRVIIEGDGILPRLGISSSLHHHANKTQNRNVVHSVFIIEPNEDKIFQNLYTRKRGFESSSQEAQRAFAHASWLFGKWLEEEAKSMGLPTVKARPYDSLAERILETVE